MTLEYGIGTIKEKGGGVMALHDNLKDVRNRVGMSQEFVADQLGISRQAVTKWELGQSKPSAKNLQALAELYHVSSEELLSNTQQKGPNLILRTNLTKWAIIFQSAFLYSCTQEIFQLRHPTEYPDKDFYRGAFIFQKVIFQFYQQIENRCLLPDTGHRSLCSSPRFRYGQSGGV